VAVGYSTRTSALVLEISRPWIWPGCPHSKPSGCSLRHGNSTIATRSGLFSKASFPGILRRRATALKGLPAKGITQPRLVAQRAVIVTSTSATVGSASTLIESGSTDIIFTALDIGHPDRPLSELGKSKRPNSFEVHAPIGLLCSTPCARFNAAGEYHLAISPQSCPRPGLKLSSREEGWCEKHPYQRSL
jgi:hypothetical protein